MIRAILLLPAIAAASAASYISAPATVEADDPSDAPVPVQQQTARLTTVSTSIATSAAEPYSDHRAWQHGINLLHVNGRWLVIWSSWGAYPEPVPTPEGNWAHDVYYSWLDPNDPQLDPQTLVSAPEAQEPASAAVSASGRILMSCEDGNPDINQHAGLWDADLNPLVGYPMNVRTGGHSGHVAALGDQFLVAYSEGWIDGGGVDNLGTGDDVWARVIGDDGAMGPEIPISVNPAPDRRDWWPEVAASDRNWLEVWQRYPSDTLHGAIINPDGTRGPEFQITDHIRFYYYNASYLPSLGLYAVFGTRDDGGFVSLIDRQGNVVLTRTRLPETVRESRLVSRHGRRGAVVTAIYPTLPTGVAVLKITDRNVLLDKVVPGTLEWDYMGTDGAFISPHKALLATLSKQGLQFVTVHL